METLTLSRSLRPSAEILSDRKLGLLFRMQTTLAILCFSVTPCIEVLLEQEGSLT